MNRKDFERLKADVKEVLGREDNIDSIPQERYEGLTFPQGREFRLWLRELQEAEKIGNLKRQVKLLEEED
jgi:hypothetical protein